MNKKLILLTLFISSWLCTWAQYNNLELHQSVVTNSSVSLGGLVVKIFDVRDPSTAVAGDNWSQTATNPSTVANAWNAGNLGQVFGVCINTSTQHVIVAASQCYYGIPYGTGELSYQALPGYSKFETFRTILGKTSQKGEENTPLIYDLNPSDGTIKVLVSSTHNPAFSTKNHTTIYNLGSGIGNVCYDPRDNWIFATNMEDGKIYKIDATTGWVLECYNPFGNVAANTFGAAQFAPPGERLWGIGYRNSKVYYSRWNTDVDHSTGYPNEIYSVNIAANSYGTRLFSSASTLPWVPGTGLDATSNEYLDPSPNQEIKIPVMINGSTDYNYSNPVSSINFSLDGKTMLLAERTMAEAYDDSYTDLTASPPVHHHDSYLDWAHYARVLRYDLSGINWSNSMVPDYYVGNIHFYSNTHPWDINCTGGADFGFDTRGVLADDKRCEKLVWATGDGLLFDDGSSHWGGRTVPSHYGPSAYGITGIPITGNTLFDPLYTTSDAVNVNSVYVDIFSPSGSNLAPKTRPGSISVYNKSCDCPTSFPITLQVLDANENPVTEVCVGTVVTIKATIGNGTEGYYGNLLFNGGNESGFFQNSISLTFPIDANALSAGVGIVTLVGYLNKPNSKEEGDNWCNATTKIVKVIPCEDVCDIFLGTDAISKTITSIGADYHDVFTSTAPDYIIWLVDGHEEFRGTATDIFHMDYSHYTAGKHTVCLKSAHNINDPDMDHARCCFNQVCDQDGAEVDDCPTWRTGNKIKPTLNPANWREVTFTYSNTSSTLNLADVNIVWHFGTDGDFVAAGTDPVTHIFTTTGTFDVCADITWTKHPEIPWSEEHPEACCCVDNKCTKITIDPCRPWIFNISQSLNSIDPTRTDFSVTPSLSTIIITHSDWSVDPFPGPFPTTFTDYSGGSGDWPDVLVTGSERVSAYITYDMSYPPAPGETYGQLFQECHATPWTTVNSDGQPKLLAYYPNPAGDQVSLEVNANLGESCIVTFVNQLGQPMLDKKFDNLKAGVNHLTIGTHILENGFYYMKVTVGDQPQTVKLVKARF